jgi:predicted nucleotidyltransferase
MIDAGIADIVSLASKYPHISRAGVFGSYARGEQTEGSDIDVLYDYVDDCEFVADVMNYGAEMAAEFGKMGVELDYHSYLGVLYSRDAGIRDNILGEVVWVYVKNGDC